MPEILKTGMATLTTFVLLIGLWTAAIDVLGVPSYVLPRPSAIGDALWRGWVHGFLRPHAWFTIRGAFIGFAIGTMLGILAGVIVAEIRIAAQAIYPIVIAIQSMPTIAIAPLIIVYFGVGLPSKVVTVALLCFFPVFVNTVAGLRSADPRLVDLYRSASATRLRLFLDVKFPSALDHILVSLQVALVLAFVGCVVSEFIASTAGLGHIIKTFANDLNTAVMFAAILSLAVIGATTGSLIQFLHRRIVFWRRR